MDAVEHHETLPTSPSEVTRRLFLGGTAGALGAATALLGNPLSAGAVGSVRGRFASPALIAAAPVQPPPDLATATRIATDVTQYLTALIMMEYTRLQQTNVPPGVHPTKAQMNQFANVRTFPTPEDTIIIRPNFDTLYSLAFLDLTEGPVILSMTKGTGDLYFVLQMLDMWSDTFAVPGTRTTGNGRQRFVVVPEGWTGALPRNMTRVDAPTPYVWVIGRFQTKGPPAFPTVHAIQDGLEITTLDGQPPHGYPVDPNVDMTTPPVDQWNALSGQEIFEMGASLMMVNPPHDVDHSIVWRMSRLGLVPGQDFDYAAQTPEVQAGIDAAPALAKADLAAFQPNQGFIRDGWFNFIYCVGNYGTQYNVRMHWTTTGTGANEPVDAVYPGLRTDSNGDPVDGNNNYVWHSEADQLPPVDAFWSLTLYNGQGFVNPNPLDRFSLGSDTPTLQFNPDGSLDIYFGPTSPGPELESNWLPSPPGPIIITLRAYQPGPSALNGSWTPTPVVKI